MREFFEKWWPALVSLTLFGVWLDRYGVQLVSGWFPTGQKSDNAPITPKETKYGDLLSQFSKDSAKVVAEDLDLSLKKNNPFRVASSKKVRRRRAKRIPPPRNFSLRGTVGTTVATIKNGKGKTIIVSVGDQIDSAKVIQIHPNKVVLRDRSGKFTIEMKE